MYRHVFALLFLVVALGLTACGGGDAPALEVVSSASVESLKSAPAPDGAPDLLLSGAIENRNSAAGLALDLATLERLSLVRYDVEDPWLKRRVEYTGVLLSDLLEFAGVRAGASVIEVVALDDYKATISLRDLDRWPILLATLSDGKRMPVKKGGPSRIVFPYDDYEIDKKRHDPQWVWSVKTIDVR